MSPDVISRSILRSTGSPTKTTLAGNNNQPSHARPPRNTPKKSGKEFTLSVSAHSDQAKRKIEAQRQLHHQQNTIPPNSSTDLETISAPGSVLLVNPLVNVSLTRDLSDLSGSYINGSTSAGPGSFNKVPGSIYQSDQSQTSYQRPWRHAKILSSGRLPQHPQPPVNDEMSVGAMIDRTKVSGATSGVTEVNQFDRSVTIEVVQTAIDQAARSALSYLSVESVVAENIRRVPLLLLLMDPSRKMYELMQMWIDVEADTVRSIVHTLQKRLGDSWKQDYDGVFQVRNNHFSQLIHVLLAERYHVHPFELWVAKPWSMSAKASVSYAGGLLNHLKRIGVLSYAKSSDHINKKQIAGQSGSQQQSTAGDDMILTLSKEAQQRIYVPGGIMKHHHACQFLSFSPPFEATGTMRVDVLSGDIGNDTDCESSLPSQFSDSNCGYSMNGDQEDTLVILRTDENDGVVSTVESLKVGKQCGSVQPSSGDRQASSHIVTTRSNRCYAETIATASQSPNNVHLHRQLVAAGSFGDLNPSQTGQEVTLQVASRGTQILPSKKYKRLSRFFRGFVCNCDKPVAVAERAVGDDDEVAENNHYDQMHKPPHNSASQYIGLETNSGTHLDSTSSSYTHHNTEVIQYKIWDQDDAAQSTDGHSVVSESAPLLLARSR